MLRWSKLLSVTPAWMVDIGQTKKEGHEISTYLLICFQCTFMPEKFSVEVFKDSPGDLQFLGIWWSQLKSTSIGFGFVTWSQLVHICKHWKLFIYVCIYYTPNRMNYPGPIWRLMWYRIRINVDLFTYMRQTDGRRQMMNESFMQRKANPNPIEL